MESGAADLEDKYLRLRDENSSLKSRALVQDDDLKRYGLPDSVCGPL